MALVVVAVEPVQTPTTFVLKGPSALLHPSTPVLVGARRHDALSSNKKRVFARCTSVTDDAVPQDLTVDMVFAASGSSASASTWSEDEPAPGVRVVDVYSLRSRTVLVRNVTVHRDGVRVGAVQCVYDLLETDDERAAMQYCLARQEERLTTVR